MTTHEAAGTVNPNAPFLACFKCLKGKDAIDEPIVTFCGHLFCWRCLFDEVNPEYPFHKLVVLSCPICPYAVVAGSIYKDQNLSIPIYKKTETMEDHATRYVRPLTSAIRDVPPRPPAIGFSVSDLDGRIKSIQSAVQRLTDAKCTFISISERNKSCIDTIDELFKKVMESFRQTAGLLPPNWFA